MKENPAQLLLLSFCNTLTNTPCSFTGKPYYPTTGRLRLRTSCRRLFKRWSNLRRHASTNAPRDFECHFSTTAKYLSQLHKQFISPLSLVQFNWYCEHGGDNDEVLRWRRNLINLFFPKDVYRRSDFIFPSRSRSPSHARRCFRKERKEK